jgi:hypothetical protein
MEALKLQKKYPEVSRDEMFDLINRFKCVSLYLGKQSSDFHVARLPLIHLDE